MTNFLLRLLALSLLAVVALCPPGAMAAEAPLRVYIRSGPKTHGPGQHDHPRFLAEWTKLLTERGAVVSGGDTWPAPAQFPAFDVIIVFAPDPWDVTPETRAAIDAYAKRGGGFLVLHDGVCSHQDPTWVRTLIGGAWKYGAAKYFEGDLSFYYVNNADPIVAGASNFEVNDEMYYDLDMDPEAEVLAATWTPDARAQRNGRAFPTIYSVAPQIWSFDNRKHRAFVDLLGHNYTTLELPHVRAVLLRGLAWVGQRARLEEFCSEEELASLRYPVGGPSKPGETLAKLSVHPDFKVSLVAAEPLITKPIAIDWDARGRMWIAETPEYPNGRRGLRPDFAGVEWKDHGGLVAEAGRQVRPAHDRISILTDNDGDGVADKKEVFFDGLELVTGFVFYKDGVIVSAAPDILWLRDTNGDGKADTVTKLYTGLGTRDTHAVINNLRWGFDGWIYATHGYSGSDHVTAVQSGCDFGRIGSGVVRFKPDGSAFEQYSSKGGNTWGLAITPEDRVLWTQPTSGDLLMETVLPESVLAKGKVGDQASFRVAIRSPKSFPLMTWEQQAYRQIDWVGSFTAAAGCAIYDGGTWPARLNGTYFTTEPTINIVHQEFLEPSGVSLAGHKEPGREETEFVRSSDMWFRPIEARVGPDGALYLLDFYNQAVIHNDTRGPVHNNVNAAVRPDRDHYFGRIWRIDHHEATPHPVPELKAEDHAGLIAALEHPNRAVRFNAQRLLVESSAPDDAACVALASDPTKPAFARVHALWTLLLKGAPSLQDGALLRGALRDPEPLVALHALKIIAEKPALGATAHAELLTRLRDPDPRLQLAALLAVGALEAPAEFTPELVQLVPTLTLPALQSAALAAASRAPVEFIRAAFQPPSGAGGGPVSGPHFLLPLARMAASSPAAAAQLVVALARPGVSAEQALPILLGLAEHRQAEPPPWSAELQVAFSSLLRRAEVQAAAVPLAIAWDREGQLRPSLRHLIETLSPAVREAQTPAPERERLVSTLFAARVFSPETLGTIAGLLGDASVPAPLQRHVLLTLGETDESASGAALIAAYPKLHRGLQDEAFAQIVKRPAWTRAFLEAIQAGTVPLATLGTIATDKLRHHPDAAVAKYAISVFDAQRGPVTEQKDQLIASLLPAVQKDGDPLHGHELFLSTCAVCHQYNGEGKNLAPDLTGIGAHPRAELLTAIVDPNREVDPTFIAYDFQTKSGESFQGVIARENAQTVLVRDAAGERELQKSEVASRHELGRSLMPEGFEALGADSLRDIIAYLQSADARFRVLDLRAACTADSRKGLFAREDAVNDTLQFRHFGDVRVGEVPFVVVDPAVAPKGKNLIVLKGGEGLAKGYPLRVEIPVPHVEASVLEILGGVGGWAFPCCGDEKGSGLPVVKMTVTFQGGATEEFVYKNGIEFADFARPHNVAGSKAANDLVRGQQVRVIRQPLTKGEVIDKITLESFDSRVAPVFVAITAEKAK